jgi:NhaC family Na+:H+ antiporter
MAERKKFDLLLSLSPLFFLLFFVVSFRLFSNKDPLHGPHQISLFLAGFLALIQRIQKSHTRKSILLALKRNLHSVLPAMRILLFVGMLIGAWASAGVLGSLVYVGIQILSPSFFLPGVAIVSGISAVLSGSSWTTAGTLGVALMGVGQVYGIAPEVCAGAIVSGCYFGDKLSPLSDTTILASSMTGVKLFEHIRYMLRTTLPSFIICLVLYSIWNFFHQPLENLGMNSASLLYTRESLHFDVWNFLPVMLVFGFSVFGMHPLLALGMGIVSASLLTVCRGMSLPSIGESLIFGYKSHTGNVDLDTLLGGGGVLAIFPTECLILSAVWFGGILEGMGYLHEIIDLLKIWIREKWDVLLATMGSSFVLNLTTADQYLSLVVPARAFRNLAREFKLEPKDVSRALEDSGTISSPLVPWNSCGAFMATSLKVTTLGYLPFAWFNLIHILLSIGIIFYRRKKEN